MKFFKLMMIALVAMVGMSSCSQSSDSDSTCDHDLTCDHNFIEHDYSKDIVGTWTVLLGNYADAMVIKADGTMNRTIVVDGKLVEYSLRYELVSNQITLFYENGDVEKGRVDVIPDVGLSITLDDKTGDAYKFFCCEKDLSEEILGMWVCNDSKVDAQNDMLLQTFKDNGTTLMTGYLPESEDKEYVLNEEGKYKVVGDLLILEISTNNAPIYVAKKMIYTPDATEYGDVMTFSFLMPMGDNMVASSESWLRIKDGLNLTGKIYDYSSAYVTNAKGTDEDFTITGQTFNIAKIKAGDFDMMFRSVLFCVEFLNATTVKQHFFSDDAERGFETPITVDGNKVTLKMSEGNHSFRDVEMYMFQDQDDCQLHMYMHTDAFINYFANLEVVTLLTEDKIDLTDDVAIEKVFDDMEARIESINVSFVLKARE